MTNPSISGPRSTPRHVNASTLSEIQRDAYQHLGSLAGDVTEITGQIAFSVDRRDWPMAKLRLMLLATLVEVALAALSSDLEAVTR